MPTYLGTHHRHHTNLIAVVIVILFLVSGLLTLPLFGMSWDEGLGNFFFGERYLHYLTTFQEKYLDFKADLPLHSEHALDLFPSTMRNNPEEFPGLFDTASAASMYVMSYGLGLMDAVDGFHCLTILLTAVFLLLFYKFSANQVGELPALICLLFLVTFPRLWGDMHFNVKDVPEMVFFGSTLIAFWKWFERPCWKWAIIAGIAGGTAVGVKANALFLPFVMILGVWPTRISDLWLHLKKYFSHYMIMLVCCGVTYFISWPYLYSNPLKALDYFKYISSQGGRGGEIGWNWQPLKITAATLPEIMLACLIIGLIIAGFKVLRREKRIYRYLLVWSLFPVLRASIPPSVNFDGIRHFIEFLPAAALLAGIGAAWLIELISTRWIHLKVPLSLACGILLLVNSGINFYNFGSYQYIYFNSFAGGLPGGAQYFGANEATDYWAVSYRQGMQWLNDNAPMGSVVHVPVAGHLIDLTGSLWLRSDIRVIDEGQLSAQSNLGNPIYIMFVTRPQFYKNVALNCANNQNPDYQILVQNKPILKICTY